MKKKSKYYSKLSVNVDNNKDYNSTTSHEIISVPGYSVFGYEQNIFCFDYSSTTTYYNK